MKTRAHEDTWTTNSNGEIRIENGTLIVGYLREDVRDLAAQAPAMARLLLELMGDPDLDDYAHTRVEAVLRAAGVLL